MNPKTTFKHSVRQALVALLSIGLALGPLADAARAQTPLADIPIASKVTAKPNIVYTLDDSGSMQFSYLPDWVIAGAATTAVTKITRVGATATVQVASTAALSVGQWVIITGANQPEYNGQFQIVSIPNGTTFTIAVVGTPVSPATPAAGITYAVATAYCRGGTTTAACSAGSVSAFNSPPFYASSFNHLMYDPNVNYQPPVKYDGSPLTHTIGTDTDAAGNQIYSNVQPDPFTAPAAAHVNLTAKVAVPLYCNTDWPITKGGPTSGLTIADVGDANGENSPPVAGVGDWCRINGTEYKASAASTAPAVTYANGNLLYDYPYKSSSGATGAQYFYQQLANKILYCDKTSPYWPKVQGAITGCTLGGTPTCGGLPCAPVITKQTCNLSTPGKTCNPTTALRNFTPAVCKTPSALYCLPSVGGSDGNSPGTGTAPECLPCTCNADFQPASTKKCSVVGNACTSVCGTPGCDLAECPNQSVTPAPNGCSAGVPIYNYSPAGSTTCTAFLWDPIANKPSTTTTTIQDSNAQGYACRHNNQVYAVSGAPAAGGLFTYPRTSLGDVYAANKTGVSPYTQTGAFITPTTSGCPTIGTTINIPRHYYTIDSIAFCDNIDSTVNGQWRGFGAGVCKPTNDLTKYQNVQYGQFHRVGLWVGHADYPYTDQVTGLPLTRNDVDELTNYANWYAYYRLRAHSAKTTSSLAFNLLDDTYRVGFHTLGQEPPPVGPSPATNAPVWVDVDDFTTGVGKQRNLWWNALFAVPTVTNVKTPSLSAMLRIGNLFETGGAGGLPGNVYPLPAGAKDPLKDTAGNVVSCQSNYHIEFTDGFTNQIALPTVAGEQDNVTPAVWPAPGLLADGVTPNPDNVLPDLPTGTTWPPPFKWGTKPVLDTLADVGMYYWARDLRPGVKDDVPSWSGKAPNDVDPTKDVAWWQHVQFSALSFGSAGTLDVENQSATLDAMQPPPVGVNLQWPDLTNPNNPPLPAGNKGAVGIDDLWHATVNARGAFVFATSPLEVQYGLGAILAGISNQRKSRSGAAFSGQVLSTSNDIIYEPTIEPGWGGDLLKVQIDSDPKSPTVGQELATLWHAAAVLGTQIKPAFLGDEPWMDETKRRIVTLERHDANGVPRDGGGRPAGAVRDAARYAGPVWHEWLHAAADGRLPARWHDVHHDGCRRTAAVGQDADHRRHRHRPVPEAPGRTAGGHLQRATARRVRPGQPGDLQHRRRSGLRRVRRRPEGSGLPGPHRRRGERRHGARVRLERWPRDLRLRTELVAAHHRRRERPPDGHSGPDVPGRRRTALQAPFLRRFIAADGRRRLQQRRALRRRFRLAHDRRRRHGQGRQCVLRARPHQRRCDRRGAGRGQAAVGILGCRLEVHVRPPDHREDVPVRVDGHRDVRLQQRLRRRPHLPAQPEDRQAAKSRAAVYHDRRGLLPRARWRNDADERPRADQRLHEGLPQPVRRAGLRRRSVRQPVAIRSDSDVGQLPGAAAVRRAHRSGRQAAADHHCAADRDRPRERRRPLRLHRHRPPARRHRPHARRRRRRGRRCTRFATTSSTRRFRTATRCCRSTRALSWRRCRRAERPLPAARRTAGSTTSPTAPAARRPSESSSTSRPT